MNPNLTIPEPTNPIAAGLRHGETFDGLCGSPLRVALCTFPATNPAARRFADGEISAEQFAADRKQEPVKVLATSDGRSIAQVWHPTGKVDPEDWIIFERWTPEGCESHGFADARTRAILQVG